MTVQTAIAKLERAADRLIPDCIDRYEHRVSIAFGAGKDYESSRVQAGVILRNLANELWCSEVNGMSDFDNSNSLKGGN